jgi:hypothetical protein
MANIPNAHLIERNAIKKVSELRYISDKKTSCNTPRLDTLAQPCIFSKSKSIETLEKRAFAKYYTMQILYPLIDLKNDREKMYWNTFHCVNTLEENTDGKIIAKYCKNRWCIVCNKIRTGILHNTHKKSLKGVKTKFVTLTTDLTKTCFTKEDLDSTYDIMVKAFYKCWRNTKNKFGKLKALRKSEVTWKLHRGTFHPHFHIIMENNSNEADYLVSQWLKQFPNADPKAQHIGLTDDKVFNETFKYICKMWNTEYDSNTGEYKIVLPYPPDKMDNIFEVFKGRRIIQTYNLNDIELDDFDDIHATVFTEEIRDYNILWDWNQKERTWIDYNTGELRTQWKNFSKKQFNTE